MGPTSVGAARDAATPRKPVLRDRSYYIFRSAATEQVHVAELMRDRPAQTRDSSDWTGACRGGHPMEGRVSVAKVDLQTLATLLNGRQGCPKCRELLP